ncbi:hypothetical protein [Bernardetia sp.]|uniref:hypothetical protein n=1 Tax=Bernardetia sp. TaxID=1937974 RepID=UPI0025BD6ECF|nr:hypothetical protein [Bernardetia sp.]
MEASIKNKNKKKEQKSTLSSRFSMNWIVSSRYDGFFFIGSCVFTLGFLAIFLWAETLDLAPHGDSIILTYFVFTAIFDHPHIFQTFSRTHADKEEFEERKHMHTWGLAAFIVVGLAITLMGFEKELIVFAAFFGSWHIIRQHSGFLKAYKGVNQDFEKIDEYLDLGLFYSGMFVCFFRDYSDIKSPVVIYRELTANFPYLPPQITEVVWSVFIFFLVLFVLRQGWRLYKRQPINVPKILFLVAALSTHYFVFFLTALPFLVAESLETVYHNIQYQGFVMHYQRKRFSHIKNVVLKWFGVAMIYGLVVGTIEIVGLMTNGWAKLLFVPFTMIVIYHYYIDGLIWKFGKNPELRKLLFDKTNKKIADSAE